MFDRPLWKDIVSPKIMKEKQVTRNFQLFNLGYQIQLVHIFFSLFTTTQRKIRVYQKEIKKTD